MLWDQLIATESATTTDLTSERSCSSTDPERSSSEWRAATKAGRKGNYGGPWKHLNSPESNPLILIRGNSKEERDISLIYTPLTVLRDQPPLSNLYVFSYLSCAMIPLHWASPSRHVSPTNPPNSSGKIPHFGSSSSQRWSFLPSFS